MRILLLSAPFRYYKGGSELQYSLISDSLRKRNFDVNFLFNYKLPVEEDNCYTYRYLLRSSYSRYCFTDALRIYSLIRKIQPAVIYKRGINYISLIGLMYACKHNIKYVQHLANQWDISSKRPASSVKERIRSSFDYYINKRIIKHSHTIVAQTQSQSDQLFANYSRNADLVIPNFFPIPEHLEDKPDQVQVVWIANLKKVKSPELFIQLAGAMKDTEARFLMIGRDPENAWSGSLKQQIHNTPNLNYLGEKSIEDVNSILNSSHIFVNTSKHEGFPNTFIQAAMHKVPIVSLHVDPDDILKGNKMGFHSGSFQQMVSDTGRLLEDTNLRRKYGENAYQYALNNHSMNNVEQLISIFRGN